MGSLWSRILWIGAVLAAAVIAVVLVAVAFGGGKGTVTKAEYQATVVNVRDRVDFALERITRPKSPDQLVALIHEASTTVGAAAEELDDAKVAKGFDDENETLVSTLRAFSDELENTSEQFADPAFASTVAALRSLSFTQWTKVNAILAELEKQGIDVQPLERH